MPNVVAIEIIKNVPFEVVKFQEVERIVHVPVEIIKYVDV